MIGLKKRNTSEAKQAANWISTSQKTYENILTKEIWLKSENETRREKEQTRMENFSKIDFDAAMWHCLENSFFSTPCRKTARKMRNETKYNFPLLCVCFFLSSKIFFVSFVYIN